MVATGVRAHGQPRARRLGPSGPSGGPGRREGSRRAARQKLGLGRPAWSPLVDEPVLHPGRSATVSVVRSDGDLGLSGRVGELHPSLVERWELRVERVIVAELSIAGLSSGQLQSVRATPISRHPAVERDLAVIVPEAIPAAAVDAVVRRSAGSLLVDVRLFDVYRGAPLAPARRAWPSG